MPITISCPNTSGRGTRPITPSGPGHPPTLLPPFPPADHPPPGRGEGRPAGRRRLPGRRGRSQVEAGTALVGAESLGGGGHVVGVEPAQGPPVGAAGGS